MGNFRLPIFRERGVAQDLTRLSTLPVHPPFSHKTSCWPLLRARADRRIRDKMPRNGISGEESFERRERLLFPVVSHISSSVDLNRVMGNSKGTGSRSVGLAHSQGPDEVLYFNPSSCSHNQAGKGTRAIWSAPSCSGSTTLTGSVINSSRAQKHRLLADSFCLLFILYSPAPAGPARRRTRLPRLSRILTEMVNRFRPSGPQLLTSTSFTEPFHMGHKLDTKIKTVNRNHAGALFRNQTPSHAIYLSGIARRSRTYWQTCFKRVPNFWMPGCQWSTADGLPSFYHCSTGLFMVLGKACRLTGQCVIKAEPLLWPIPFSKGLLLAKPFQEIWLSCLFGRFVARLTTAEMEPLQILNSG